MVGAVQDASRNPALPELEEPLAPELVVPLALITWVASEASLGQDPLQVIGIMGLVPAPLNASRIRA